MNIKPAKLYVSDGAIISEEILPYGGFVVCHTGRERADDDDKRLTYLAHAANNYPALVEALEKIVGIMASTDGPESLVEDFKDIARAALAAAKGA